MTENKDIAISLKDISLLYPKNNKGIGSIRELITGRMKKQDSITFSDVNRIRMKKHDSITILNDFEQ